MHKNNYTPWYIKIYMYVVQMHIKSEVKASKLEYIRVLQVLVHCFAHMVSTVVAYNICVFEAKHLLSTNTQARVCYNRVGLPVNKKHAIGMRSCHNAFYLITQTCLCHLQRLLKAVKVMFR